MVKIIADRYELLELIGQGGMADVYLAKDNILNRTIAVKILRTNLAKDPIYIARFQREASAAASLSHKNIVEIYDVGEDNNQYYIVMEYVPGQTLKELIHKRGALHYVEAIDIMKQVVSGVAKAHQLGIIHRDLKPQNILVTDSGNAKIADFGIASMQTLAQVTQTDVIMGSLHYLAPELARGEKATSQSDIYALGIVLYELLRGEVPFTGESPVNIALKHMQADIPSLTMFNPSIPQSVENIVIKATAKNLKNRYKNAMEMLEDIKTCLERKEEEKLVFVDDSAPDPTIIADGKTMFTKKADLEEEYTPRRSNPTKKNKSKKENPLIKKFKSLDKKLQIGIGACTAVVLAFAIFLVVSLFGNKSSMLPDLAGMEIDEANKVLEKYEVTIDEDNIEYELSEKYKKDLIIETTPKSGKSIKKGDKIKVVLSKGKVIVMKSYVGKDVDEATKALEKLKFKVEIEEEVSAKAKGTVIKQSIKKGEKVDPTGDMTITLTVSKGRGITIGNYVGKSYDSAYAELSGMGFNVIKNEEESDKAKGTVIRQSKDPNTTFEPDGDLTITLTVSAGKTYDVPNVVGYSYEEAQRLLNNKGFDNVVLRPAGNAPSLDRAFTVKSQSPGGNTTVDQKGTAITLYYYEDYIQPEGGTE